LVANSEENSQHRKHTEDTIILGLLDAVEDNASLTQRDLSRELGIALGLVNSYLKRCVRKGLLKVSEVPTKRYAYYLTPQGFAEKSTLTARYLANSFEFLRRAREQMSELFEQGILRREGRFILLGHGDLADVAMLVASRSAAEIIATLPATHDSRILATATEGLDFDRAIITATEDPQATYAAAIAIFGHGRVYAPKLLRIRMTNPVTVEANHD